MNSEKIWYGVKNENEDELVENRVGNDLVPLLPSLRRTRYFSYESGFDETERKLNHDVTPSQNLSSLSSSESAFSLSFSLFLPLMEATLRFWMTLWFDLNSGQELGLGGRERELLPISCRVYIYSWYVCIQALCDQRK